jgi:hypothetical protein
MRSFWEGFTFQHPPFGIINDCWDCGSKTMLSIIGLGALTIPFAAGMLVDAYLLH